MEREEMIKKLHGIKKIVDEQFKEKMERDLEYGRFKDIILLSIENWKQSKISGSLTTSSDYPPPCDQKNGIITFYWEIWEEIRNKITNDINFLEIVNAFVMHECFHVYLGHIGNEGDEAEKQVNGCMTLFFNDVQKIFADNFQEIEDICKKYAVN